MWVEDAGSDDRSPRPLVADTRSILALRLEYSAFFVLEGNVNRNLRNHHRTMPSYELSTYNCDVRFLLLFPRTI
jgi:hypothetical protein